jgi:hypothetical protein
MKQYNPQGDPSDDNNVYGYVYAQTLVHVLKECGDDLSRENVMRHAANIKDLDLGMLLPGIKLNTRPDDYFPVKQAQFMRFDGKEWVRIGNLMGN